MSTAALRANGIKFADGSNAPSAVNIRSPEYGAVGDGVADDTAAIAAAIAACPSGGVMFMPPGNYNLVGSSTEIFLINKPMYLVGAGWGTNLKVLSTVPATRDVFHVTAPVSITGLMMRDFQISAINGTPVNITGATNATPIAITATAHGYSTGQAVTIAGVGGNTNANGTYIITNTGANTFTLNGSAGNAAYTSGGTSAAVPGRHSINLDVTTGGNTIQNVVIDHVATAQLGGRAIVTTNTVPQANGIFLVDVVDCILRGGVNLAKAGDSINIIGNTITGGFNAIDVDLVQGAGNPLGGGAHLLVVERNNITSQGAALKITNGSQFRFHNNNVEPGATGSVGVDNSNAANNAVIDCDGNSTTPIVASSIRGNYIANWSNFSTNGDCIRANWTRGLLVEHNDCERSVAGPVNYRITANAVGTMLCIPVTEDGNLPALQVGDLGTTTMTHFYGSTGKEEFGATSSVTYGMVIRGGSTQSGDIFAIKQNAGTNSMQVSNLGNVLMSAATDNGYPFHCGNSSYFDGRAVFAGSPSILSVGANLASATTIAPVSHITHITGTTTIQTITPPTTFATSNLGGVIYLIFDGVAPWNAAGNIFIAGTPTTAGTVVMFTYDNATSKWYPSRLA